ncbi:hypothetical protein ACFVHQ_13400 [Actinomycetes bacterium NPDC127524]
MEKFPNGHSLLIEAGMKEIEEKEDSSLVIDTFPALVCSSDCGYYERGDYPRIIGEQGPKRLLLLYPNEQERILEIGRVLYPPIYIHSLLARGYWEPYE